MSDQGDGAPDYGTGATGADAFGADEGVDQHYLGQPESGHGSAPNLDRIYARMDELTAQQQAIVEALQTPDFDYYGDQYDGEEEEPTIAELAAEHGLDPGELLAALGEEPEPDIIDQIESAIDRRLEAEDAEEALEDRELDWQDLRERMPILQDEPTARAIINRAVDLAQNWDESIIETPAMVNLIELVAKAAIGDQAVGREQAVLPPQVQLESAQGAAQPAAQPSGSDYWGNRVVQAAQRLRPQI